MSNDNVCFDTDLIVRYGGRGPRYTSYPTALQFNSELTVEQYKENAIASNETGVPLSTYVHIPFCHSLCYYCGCNKIVTRNAERVEKYMGNLYREIDMQSELFDSDRKVEQLHFGGGTPTYLDEPQLRDLMQKLGRAFNFDTGDGREFSIEVDPRTVDEKGIHLLWELGFNRLSMGIQDFEPSVQKAVNRMQSADEVRTLTAAARDAGFGSISYDLIYGLPHQTVESFDRTLKSVIDMRPDRLAVYNYAHLPQRFKGQRMINDADIPLPETKLGILDRTIEILCGAGYIYIGMDHFALPGDELVRARRDGTLQRNFQGYSTHRQCDLVALGVSGIGNIGNMFAQNSVRTDDYEAMLEEGRLPLVKGLIVDAEDQVRAAVIQSLMCYDSLDFNAVGAEQNIDFRDYFAKEIRQLEPLAEDDLIELDDKGVTITPKGRLLLRSIAMVFDRYIDQQQNDNRFSKAI
jgi:oxygen-independent coproporphyrinogen-3 oxidase